MAKDVVVRVPNLHPAQAAMVREAKRFNVLMCGRRFGKTALAKDRVIDGLLSGQQWGWFAPTYKILDGAWRELVAVLDGVPGFEKNEQKLRMTMGTKGLLECWSLDTEDPARSRGYDGIVVDEAGLVPNLAHIWHSALRPTLAQSQGPAWFLGSPKTHGDFTAFYAKGQSGEPDWISWNKGMFDNPYIPAEEIVSLRQSLPPDDFQREVMGQPTDDGGNPFGYDAIAACTQTMALGEGEPVVWGWDVARSVDFTVGIALDAQANVVRFARWQGLPWGETVRKIQELSAGVECWGDATGVGDPIMERLVELGVQLNPYVFSQRSKQVLMTRLASCLQMREVTIPAGVLVSELNSFTYRFTDTGTRYSAPEGVHDDCVMALALALYGYDRVRPTVRAVEIPRNTRQDQIPWQSLAGLLGGETEGFETQLGTGY